MPFQALPIAFGKVAGSPLAKLLLIYLMKECELVPKEDLGGVGRESALLNFDATEAAAFCEVTRGEIYAALADLERLRLAYPDEVYLAQCAENFRRPEDRWDFLVVSLPVSPQPAADRRRIKCSDDQMDLIRERGGFRCSACGGNRDDEFSWHVDHIIPRSVGGADVEENCQAICGRCNSRKGARVHWIDFLGGRN